MFYNCSFYIMAFISDLEITKLQDILSTRKGAYEIIEILPMLWDYWNFARLLTEGCEH